LPPSPLICRSRVHHEVILDADLGEPSSAGRIITPTPFPGQGSPWHRVMGPPTPVLVSCHSRSARSRRSARCRSTAWPKVRACLPSPEQARRSGLPPGQPPGHSAPAGASARHRVWRRGPAPSHGPATAAVRPADRARPLHPAVVRAPPPELDRNCRRDTRDGAACTRQMARPALGGAGLDRALALARFALLRTAGGRRGLRQRGQPRLLPRGAGRRQAGPPEAPVCSGRGDDALPARDGPAARRAGRRGGSQDLPPTREGGNGHVGRQAPLGEAVSACLNAPQQIQALLRGLV
jgi:hypothetical protein